MFMIHMPNTFRVGDTAGCRINAEPKDLTWRDVDTLVIEPGDARHIAQRFDAGGDLVCFVCADAACDVAGNDDAA